MIKNYIASSIRILRFNSCQLTHVSKLSILLLFATSLQVSAAISIKGATAKVNNKAENDFITEQTADPITGVIRDERGQALPGAVVRVKNSTISAVTNTDGVFKINANQGQVLVVTFVGYTTREVTVSSQTNLTVQLQPADNAIEEVVVVGYGTQRKKDLTGSVSSISAKDIADMRVQNPDQLLQGRFAGVHATSRSGKPGANMTVQIRGVNSLNGNEPLYVVDGIPIGNGAGADFNSTQTSNFNQKASSQTSQFDIGSINPADIASIDILKDASATAIYGSRAANGVVVITTKSGQAGKTTLNFNASTGVQSLVKEIEMLDGQQYMEFINTATRIGTPSHTTHPVFANVINNIGPLGYNTNWQDAVYQNAPLREFNLSASGGTEKVNFYFSGGYNDQQGILGGELSGYNRYSGKIRVETQLLSWLKIGVNGNASVANSRLQEMMNNFSPTYDALAAAPILPVRWSLDNTDRDIFGFNNPSAFIPGGYSGPTGVPGNGTLRRNPVAFMESNDRNVQKYQGFGTIFADINIFKGLKYHIDLNGTFNTSTWRMFSPRFFYGYNSEGANNYLRAGNTIGYQKDFAQYFTYDFTKNFLTATLTAGHNTTYYNDYNIGGERVNALIPTYYFNSYERAGESVGSSRSDRRLQSFFARGNFSFYDKYLITATIRRDGSDRFAPGNKYGNFPSLAGAWRLSEENFMKSVDWVSDVKLRLGWGATGAQNISGFQFQSSMSGEQITNFGNNSSLQSVAYFGNIPNPDIKWETTYSTNAGIDATFFNRHLSVVLDVYRKNTKDLLLGSFPIPGYIAFPSPTINLGEFKNQGVEIEMNYRNILNNDRFTWDAGVNFARNVNEAIDIGPLSLSRNGAGFISTGNNMRVYEGGSLGTFYGRKTIGIFQTQAEIDAYNTAAVARATELGLANPGNARYQQNVGPGDIIYADVNGVDRDGKILYGVQDGKVDGADVVALGSALPKFTYGVNTRFSYKGLDLFIVGQGVYGNTIYNRNLQDFEALDIRGDVPNQTVRAWENRWISPSQPGDGRTPRVLGLSNTNNTEFSDRYLEDGSFFRIKNITLGYTVPDKFTKKVKISRMRIFATATDYFTFTNYSWYNPDIGAFDNNNMGFGVDYAGFPMQKSLSFGVNVGF